MGLVLSTFVLFYVFVIKETWIFWVFGTSREENGEHTAAAPAGKASSRASFTASHVISSAVRTVMCERGHVRPIAPYDDGELNINPPTPCQ